MAIMNAEDSKIMSMSNRDLIWSLYSDRFLTFGNELKLYVVDTFTESSRMFGGIKLSELSYSQILTSKCEFRLVKSMACNNCLLKHNADVLYALGYQNGKIVLNSFDSNSNSTGKESDANHHYSNYVGKEFMQEYPRSCNALDFCQIDNNLLASGFERNKGDYSVMVWDIAHTGINYNQAAQSATISGATKPLHQSALNDQVHSLKWFRNRSIICGVNYKHLKLIDARESSNQGPCALTKGVFGITADTHTDYRFASFFENYIYVWDLRFFESPLVTIGPEPSSFVKLEWCPTRSNILAALLKDTNSIRLYDHKQYTNFNGFPEPSILKRDITPFEVNNSQILSSFSWHPLNEFQMTVVTSNNGDIIDFKVVDRITLNWSTSSEIIWTHGKKILQYIDSKDSIYKEIDDIAVRMRKLAIDGYGFSVDKLWQMFCRDNPLHFVWKWIFMHMNYEKNRSINAGTNKSSINEDNIFPISNTERFNGIMSALFGTENSKKLLHTSRFVHPKNFPAAFCHKVIYISPGRIKALQYCGWYNKHSSNSFLLSSMIDDSTITDEFIMNIPSNYLITMNENEHNYTRLAAIMIFNGRFNEAIDYLNRASDFANKNAHINNNPQKSNDFNVDIRQTDKAVSLNALALALSTFCSNMMDKSNESLSIWEDTCLKMKSKLDDPYIKAIFNFVSLNTEKYVEIINDEKLDIADRVAFSCLYLPDAELIDFLFKIQENLIERHDLRAILFTGLTEDGIELFRKYIESTSDVQTISLILLWTLPHSFAKIPLVKTWIDNYKQLLDCWRLWNVRAQFDLKWYENLNYFEEPRQQIYIVCNYCRSPISTYTHHNHNDSNTKSPISHPPQISHHQYNRASSANSSSNKSRICSCSNCGKTLPRCSLCLTQLGTPAGIHWRPGIISEKSDRKLSPFSSWFTWCQTCRHGGHSIHLLEWFTENNVCPVAGCKCKCMCLDANARPISY